MPAVLIDIYHHTKFQVATIIGTLKSTSYKNLNLAKLAKVKAGQFQVSTLIGTLKSTSYNKFRRNINNKWAASTCKLSLSTK